MGNMDLGVGIIGFGFMGRMQAFCHRAIPWYCDVPVSTRLVAVATSRTETAERAKAAGFEFATADWRELVAREDVDLVHVCTPNDLHAEQTVAALEAGKHVYCDKPMAADLDGAERILAAARPARGKLGVVFQNRFFPATLRAKELVEEGFLGDVLAFRAAYLHSGYVDPARPMSWRLDRARSGAGALGDLGSHAIDMMLHLVGPFTTVSATLDTLVKERPPSGGRHEGGGMVAVEVDDAAYLAVRTLSGATGTIEASRVSTGTNDDFRFEIHGTGGALRFSLMDPNWLEAYDNTLPGEPHGGRRGFARIECVGRYDKAKLPGPKFAVGWERGHIESLASFLRCIAEDRPASPSAEDGFAAQRVIDAAQRSAAGGGCRIEL
jgi:predicted dehydrogenase